jgi:nitroreductase
MSKANNPTLETIRTRRVIRDMTDQPVPQELLEKILDAARWAPSGGNNRPNRYVVIQDPLTRRLIRIVSPGMFQHAPALILICTDWSVIDALKIPHHDRALAIDVGTAAQTIMLAAHSLGVASGPVTSFSQAAVSTILNLPDTMTPQMFICLGYAQKKKEQGMKARSRITWRDLTTFERFEDSD